MCIPRSVYNERMIRGTMALYTILCLLATLLGNPQGPQLVCRITGAPMLPVRAEVGKRPSCCDVSKSTVADGATRYTLTSPGCCDLRQSIVHAPLTAVKATTLDVPTARCPAPLPVLPFFVIVDAPSRPEWPGARSIRPPPQSSPASPRGPPAFS